MSMILALSDVAYVAYEWLNVAIPVLLDVAERMI